MKSIKEITEWLKQQKWYNQYCTNAQEDRVFSAFTDKRTPASEKAMKMIVNAFSWQHTAEGFEFWERVNREYLNWLLV